MNRPVARNLRSVFLPFNVSQFDTRVRVRVRVNLALTSALHYLHVDLLPAAISPLTDTNLPLSVPSCHFPSMRGTNGHCDRLGWFQQHLSMGANEQVSAEVNPVTGHWAQKHAGIKHQAQQLYWYEPGDTVSIKQF